MTWSLSPIQSHTFTTASSRFHPQCWRSEAHLSVRWRRTLRCSAGPCGGDGAGKMPGAWRACSVPAPELPSLVSVTTDPKPPKLPPLAGLEPATSEPGRQGVRATAVTTPDKPIAATSRPRSCIAHVPSPGQTSRVFSDRQASTSSRLDAVGPCATTPGAPPRSQTHRSGRALSPPPAPPHSTRAAASRGGAWGPGSS